MFVKILAYGFIQLLCALKGDGVSLSLTPVSMVIGSSAANPVMSLIIQCSSGGTPDIDELVFLRLSRRKFTETSFVGVASLRSSNPPARLEPTVPSDIQTKSPNVTGSVEIDKKSGTLTLSLNAQGMTCTDQAEFSCSMTYFDPGTNTQIVYDNKNFTVITVPNDVIMDSPEYYNTNGNTLQLTNNSVLAVGTRIKFRCMANVGSLPEGEIIWERTSELGSQNSFIPYTPTLSTDIVQEESQLSGCFYRRTSTMYYNLTKLDDDGISFRCRAQSFLVGQRYESLSNQQYRAVAASTPDSNTSLKTTTTTTTSTPDINASLTTTTTTTSDGVSLSLNPESMVIGSSAVKPVMSLTIQCSSGGTPDIGALVQLKLNRRKFRETSFVGVASIRFNTQAKLDPTVPADIQTKSPNITGSIDPNQNSGTLTLSLNAQGMTCIDEAEFNCSMTYIDLGEFTQIVHDNKNFTVITVPNDVIMDSPEYYNTNGSNLQLTNNSVLAVGTRIKFRCMANVGSLPEGEIIWERTPEMGSQNSFISYIPSLSTDIVQEESQQNGCFYRRTSTMYYNLTKLDEDGISFRCRAQSFLGGQQYESLSNQKYRAVAASSGGTSKSQEVSTPDSNTSLKTTTTTNTSTPYINASLKTATTTTIMMAISSSFQILYRIFKYG